MKINFLTLIFLCSICFNVTTLFAKKDTTIVFCNQSLHKVKKKYASYYIKVFKNKAGQVGVIQYTRYDLLCMKGAFSDEGLSIKHGVFEYYNSKGVLKKKGKYINEKRTGIWVTYDKNGLLTSKSNYIDDKLTGEQLKWYKDTLISSGQYELGEKIGYWQSWHKNRNINCKGSYVKGNRDGEWKFYFESGNLAAIEKYENGDATSVLWYSETGEYVAPIKPYELKPQFIGGLQGISYYIQNTFEYPELAREMGEQGTVWVEFTVRIDGVIENIKVVSGVSYSLDAEALRVIKLMPNWTPWLDHNRKKPILFSIPIKCRLG